MDYNELQNADNEELYTAMVDIMHELHHRFKAHKGMTYERWKAHIHPHIVMALNNDHGYMGEAVFTMEELVKDLDIEVRAANLILAQQDAEYGV